MRFSLLCFSLILLTLTWLAPVSRVEAVPRSQRVACGAPIPVWGVRKRGKRRYRTGYESLRSILKFYKKIFRYEYRLFSIKPLLFNDKVTAYHLRSKRSSTRWAGINIALYRRSAKIEVFIICR
jgi:hypothetical protein